MDPLTIGTAIGTSLLTSFATKGDSEPIKTLNDIWYLAFGRLQFFAEQKRVKHEAFLDLYKNELVKKVAAIPEENLIEPPLSIVGPALDASKYYIEEEMLRNMFSNIVSSSMDNRKNSRTHHAFVEIIKQLSPLDANNLKVFIHSQKLPIVNYGINIGLSEGYSNFHQHIFLHNQVNTDWQANASSLINLQRLGLLDIDYSKPFMDKTLYEPFREHVLYKEMSEIITSKEFSNQAKFFSDIIKMDHVTPKIEKGIVSVTPLGEDFLYTCI